MAPPRQAAYGFQRHALIPLEAFVKHHCRVLALLPLSLLGCPGDDDSHGHSHAHQQPDPRELMTYEDGMVVQGLGGHYEVALTLSEGPTVGVHTVTLGIDQDGQPVATDTKAVRFDAVMPDHGHGTGAVTVVPSDEQGIFTAEGLHLTMPGIWEFTVDIDGPHHRDEAVFSLLIVND